jgi:hypothetical protein
LNAGLSVVSGIESRDVEARFELRWLEPQCSNRWLGVWNTWIREIFRRGGQACEQNELQTTEEFDICAYISSGKRRSANVDLRGSMGGGKRRKQDKLSDKHDHEVGNNLRLNGPFYERTSKRSCPHLAAIDSEQS